MIDDDEEIGVSSDDDASELSGDSTLRDEDFTGLVVAPADWTIGTLNSQIGKQIDLDPAFQRRNVWSATAKSSFIESLFLGIPIPQILLSSKPENRNSFIVLDGKQRLLTIKEFLGGRFQSGRKFKLKELRVLKQLEGKTWEEISEDGEWSQRLLNETQRTAVIRNWSSEKVLYEIFYRLNSGSVKLSPMELRMSLHPGDFLKFIISWTENIGPLHELLGKTSPDNRMNDVELAVRYLAFSDDRYEYNGDLKAFLDAVCKDLNTEFTNETDRVKDVVGSLENMNLAIRFGLETYQRKEFCRKFVNGKYDNRFNRAVFDVQVGALAVPELREAVEKEPKKFKDAFELVSRSSEFIKSVESTTKTNEATRTRFQMFFNEVGNKYGIELSIPNISKV